MDSQTQQPPWFEAGRRALVLAARLDGAGAAAAVNELASEHGADALPEVMQVWADTMLSYLPPPEPGAAVSLMFLDLASGRLSGADAVKPPEAWAGQLIAARAADDPVMYRALINSVNGDDEWSERVAAVLKMCGLAVRSALLNQAPRHEWPQIGSRGAAR